MLRFYDYLPSQNCWKVRQLLAHLDLPYEQRLVEIFQGEQHKPEFQALNPGGTVPVLEVAPGHSLAVMLSRCTGSSAYLMNRRAAQAYAQGLLPMSLPYDHVFDQGWRFGLKVRLVTPTPCGHDDQIVSNIGAPPSHARKFHWTKRLSTHAFRARNEWRRLVYGLTQALREKLGIGFSA